MTNNQIEQKLQWSHMTKNTHIIEFSSEKSLKIKLLLQQAATIINPGNGRI